MGTTFVTISHARDGTAPGFWMRDQVLELWLRLLALHVPEPNREDERNLALPLRNKWLLASKGWVGGHVPHGMEDACSTPEGEAIVRAAIESLLVELNRTDTPVEGHTMSLLGIEVGSCNVPVERWKLRDVGHAMLDLLDGELDCTAMSTEIMPGSKPYNSKHRPSH